MYGKMYWTRNLTPLTCYFYFQVVSLIFTITIFILSFVYIYLQTSSFTDIFTTVPNKVSDVYMFVTLNYGRLNDFIYSFHQHCFFFFSLLLQGLVYYSYFVGCNFFEGFHKMSYLSCFWFYNLRLDLNVSSYC